MISGLAGAPLVLAMFRVITPTNRVLISGETNVNSDASRRGLSRRALKSGNVKRKIRPKFALADMRAPQIKERQEQKAFGSLII